MWVKEWCGFFLMAFIIFPNHAFCRTLFNGDGYHVEICPHYTESKNRPCQWSGHGKLFRVKGTLISGQKILLGGEMLIQPDGRILSVGCALSSFESIVTLDCPDALISPGFINLHEHIEYSYQRPKTLPIKRWTDRDQWRAATNEERGFQDKKPKNPENAEIMGERAMLRHLLSGTTALAGAKNIHAFTRNLGLTENRLGTPGLTSVDYQTFPIKQHPQSSKQCRFKQEDIVPINQYDAYVPHVGEGVDEYARCEITLMLRAIENKISPNAFIHVVAATPEQIKQLKKERVSIVLSPRSNFELYRATAPIREFRQEGINMALGTDWSVSGSLTMPDEMRCLAEYNRNHLNNFLSWADIHQMSTKNAADAVGLGPYIGELVPGKLADFVVIDMEGRRSLGEVLNHTAYKQIEAVFVAGRGVVFPSVWKTKLPWTLAPCSKDPRHLCGRSQIICGANPEHTLARLLAASEYQINDAALCKPDSLLACQLKVTGLRAPKIVV